jgi:hypothetical protein
MKPRGTSTSISKAIPHGAACLFSLGYIDSNQGNYVEAERLLALAIDVDSSLSRPRD